MTNDPPAEALHPYESFGMDVRQVRLARKMTQKGLGLATGYSEGHVSKVEAGKVTPSVKFALGCDRAFGTGDLFARQLSRALEGDYPSWFLPYLELEREASRIFDYSTTLIMGMVQTEEYARAVFRTGIPRDGDSEIESKVAARLARREVLERDFPPSLWLVLNESCLRTMVGSAEVMAQQLNYLCEQADLPSVTIQVLPFKEGPSAHHLPFTLLAFRNGPMLLHTESPQGGRPYDDAETVATASDRYDRIRADALSPAESVARLQQLAKEYTNDQPDRLDQVQLQRERRGAVHRGRPRVRTFRSRPRSGQQAPERTRSDGLH